MAPSPQAFLYMLVFVVCRHFKTQAWSRSLLLDPQLKSTMSSGTGGVVGGSAFEQSTCAEQCDGWS
eukprot:3516518-Rhodomonas_salina.2